MDKIGSGLQYNVYDLGNGRVLKTPTNEQEKLILLTMWYPKATPAKLQRELHLTEHDTSYSLKHIGARVVPFVPELVGNPVFLPHNSYEQDKVTPLGQHLETHPQPDNIRLIDKYVSCILQQWQLGFSDRMFNFAINYGVTLAGDVILIDFGEISFARSVVARLVITRNWTKSSNFLTLPVGELKDYYLEQMDATFTLDTLTQHWKTLASI